LCHVDPSEQEQDEKRHDQREFNGSRGTLVASVSANQSNDRHGQAP
jgi:hypothetical protein